MKHKNKNIIKCIMTIVLTVAMVLGAVPVEGLVLPAHAAAEETKEFSNSNITAGSTNQLNYEGNLFISATGDATASKANYNPNHITLRSPYQQEGILRL